MRFQVLASILLNGEGAAWWNQFGTPDDVIVSDYVLVAEELDWLKNLRHSKLDPGADLDPAPTEGPAVIDLGKRYRWRLPISWHLWQAQDEEGGTLVPGDDVFLLLTNPTPDTRTLLFDFTTYPDPEGPAMQWVLYENADPVPGVTPIPATGTEVEFTLDPYEVAIYLLEPVSP